MTGKIRPVAFRRHKNALVVDPRYRKVFEAQFTEGADYIMVPVQARNMAQHSGYFAEVNRTHENLDERIAHLYPTATHLRKWALCESNFCTVKIIDCGTPAVAKATAVMCRGLDQFAQIKIRGSVLTVKQALSQQIAPPPVGMDADTFKASRTAVLDLITPLARTTPDEVQKEAASVPLQEADRPARQIASQDAPEGGSISERAMTARTVPEKERAASEAPGGSLDLWEDPVTDPPKSAAEYPTYFQRRLRTIGTREAAMALWNAEESIRADLGVTSPIRRQLAAEIFDQFGG